MSSRLDSWPVVERWALLIPSEHRLLATADSPIVILTGSVQGDSRFPDGAAIVTSRVLELDPTRALARTRTGRYRLGTPSRLFLRWLAEHGHALDDLARNAAGSPAPALHGGPRAAGDAEQAHGMRSPNAAGQPMTLRTVRVGDSGHDCD